MKHRRASKVPRWAWRVLLATRERSQEQDTQSEDDRQHREQPNVELTDRSVMPTKCLRLEEFAIGARIESALLPRLQSTPLDHALRARSYDIGQ